MKLILRAIINLICLPIFLVGIILPKSKNIWVFGSWFGNLYLDNSKYLFEYIKENENEITPIWLTKNKLIFEKLRRNGRRCYYINSVLGFYFTARASIVIVSQGLIDINKFGVSRQAKVLLWHGSPIKKIAFDDRINAHPYNPLIFNIFSRIWNIIFPFEREDWDLITASSQEVKEKFISAFRSNDKSVTVTGYPRYDIILSSNLNRINSIDELSSSFLEERIILYAPTFRDGNPDFNYLDNLNLSNLNKMMEKYNTKFIIKLHPKINVSIPLLTDFENVTSLVNQNVDINILLKQSEILLTDYSSIFIDYLLLNKPIIFTPFDLNNFYKSSRELYYDYNEITPGVKCNDWNEVLEEIQMILDGVDNYISQRELIRSKFHTFSDTENCARIINRIKGKYVQK